VSSPHYCQRRVGASPLMFSGAAGANTLELSRLLGKHAAVRHDVFTLVATTIAPAGHVETTTRTFGT
jgi:hypothetical protein